MFSIASAQQDSAPSATPPRSSGPAGQTGANDAVRAARAWRRLVGELVRLVEDLDAIGLALVVLMGRIAGYRKQHGRAALTIDINLPFDLITRAMRWIRALELRLAVEAVRAKNALNAAKGWPDPPEWLDDGEDWSENFDPPRKRRERVDPADIDGKPTVEVFAQIMADLVVAALLLGDLATAQHIQSNRCEWTT
jgi:hypothetical protein